MIWYRRTGWNCCVIRAIQIAKVQSRVVASLVSVLCAVNNGVVGAYTTTCTYRWHWWWQYFATGWDGWTTWGNSARWIYPTWDWWHCKIPLISDGRHAGVEWHSWDSSDDNTLAVPASICDIPVIMYVQRFYVYVYWKWKWKEIWEEQYNLSSSIHKETKRQIMTGYRKVVYSFSSYRLLHHHFHPTPSMILFDASSSSVAVWEENCAKEPGRYPRFSPVIAILWTW